MINRNIWMFGFVVAACSASAQPLVLTNADIENNVSGQFGAIAGWGPNGGWAPHSGFSRPGNEGLGDNFGFYSAGTAESVGQIVDGHSIQAMTVYQFWSWAYPGGNDIGTIAYQIGYASTDNDILSFVPLATQTYNITGMTSWSELDGVTYTTGEAGDEIGRQLIVRLGGGAAGGDNDIWFDSFQASATVVPEPATLAALALGIAALRRRRK